MAYNDGNPNALILMKTPHCVSGVVTDNVKPLKFLRMPNKPLPLYWNACLVAAADNSQPRSWIESTKLLPGYDESLKTPPVELTGRRVAIRGRRGHFEIAVYAL